MRRQLFLGVSVVALVLGVVTTTTGPAWAQYGGGGGGGGGATTTTTTAAPTITPGVPVHGHVTTNAVTYAPGSTITATASAGTFKPGTSATGDVQQVNGTGSIGAVTATVNVDGSVTITFTVPAGIPAGIYLVVIAGTDASGNPVFTEIPIIIGGAGTTSAASARFSGGAPAAPSGGATTGGGASASDLASATPQAVLAAQRLAIAGIDHALGITQADAAGSPSPVGGVTLPATHHPVDNTARTVLVIAAALAVALVAVAVWRRPRRRAA